MSRARWLLIAAIAAYLAAVLAWMARDPRAARDAYEPSSAFSTAPDGLSLAYRYLEERPGGGEVAILDRRIDPRELEGDAVVLRVRPGFQPWWQDWAEELERRREEGKEEAEEKAEEENVDEGTEEDEETGEKAGDESEAGGGDEPGAVGEGSRAPEPEPRLLREREERWVRAGGRLVLAIDDLYAGLEVEDVEAGGDGETGAAVEASVKPVKVFPLWDGVDRLEPPAARALSGSALEGGHALWLLGGRPLVYRQPLGEGEVFLLACPEVFDNQHLAAADHLALLEALAPPGRPAYLDETFHGTADPPGLLDLIARWRLLPALGLALAAALAALQRGARRLGPPEEAYRERRSEAVDMVDSLAGLYARALGREQAIELYRRSFVDAVGHRTGLRGEALDKRAEHLLGNLKPASFEHALGRLNEAFRRLEDERRPRGRSPLG